MPSAEVQLIQHSMTVKTELIIFATKGETKEQLDNRKNDFIKNLNRYISKMGVIREVKDVQVDTSPT
jgi:hypothetical protein